jgi:hypothetical protein
MPRLNLRVPAIVAATLQLVIGPVNAQQAGSYEPFTHEANAKSWVVYDYADGNTYTPGWDSAGDGSNPDIYFTFEGSSALDFYADEFSSGGAFTGDLVAAGVDAIGCDILVEDIESFDVGEFFLFSAADNRYYYSELIIPEASGWDTAYASLTADVWYVYENNNYVPVELTPAILGNITEIGVTFYPRDVAGADGKLVGIDNFTFYGAFVPPKLTTGTIGSSFQLSFNRRPGIAYSIQASPNLSSWALVPGEGFITGTTPYMMTRPLAPGARFFKVGIEDFLTPVPQVPLPP